MPTNVDELKTEGILAIAKNIMWIGLYAMEAAGEIENLRTLLNAARKHIDHEERPYLMR